MGKKDPGPRVLRDWRDAQDPRVSQKDVGVWIGVGASRISHYETGLEDLPLQHKLTIARRTGIPLRLLLTPRQRQTVFEAAEMIGEEAVA